MRPTYENVYIGTFIFSLGYLFRKTSKGDPCTASIDLYQQVQKGEKVVGDLLTSIGGKNIIIEFKRDIKQVPNEFQKKSKEPLLDLFQSDDEFEFQSISKRCHFLSYAGVYEDGTSTLVFAPYIEIFKRLKGFDSHSLLILIGNQNFSSQYIDTENLSVGVNSEEFKIYVEKLAVGAGDSCGGMAISIDDKGIKSMVVFEDIRDLNQSLLEAEKQAESLIQSEEPKDEMMPTNL